MVNVSIRGRSPPNEFINPGIAIKSNIYDTTLRHIAIIPNTYHRYNYATSKHVSYTTNHFFVSHHIQLDIIIT